MVDLDTAIALDDRIEKLVVKYAEAQKQLTAAKEGMLVWIKAATDLEKQLAAKDETLRAIAKQKLPEEMDAFEGLGADWEGGYVACVMTARDALAAPAQEK